MEKEKHSAAAALEQAEKLRKHTDVMLRSFWFPLIFWGAATLLSGFSVMLTTIASLSIFWPIAVVAGFIAMGLYYGRRENTYGVKGITWPYVVLAVGLLVGAAVISSFGSDYTREAGPWLIISVAYLGFARLARSWFLGIVAIMLGVLAAIVCIYSSNAYLMLSIAYGASFIVSGIYARKVEMGHAYL